ncbi:MAG: hypothetical protein ACYC1C_08630 [Chloroflexota bacterium]
MVHVHVTEGATKVLEAVLAQAKRRDEVPKADGAEPLLRLSLRESEAQLTLDLPSAEDQIVESEGHAVLLLGPDVAPLLDGATVDVLHSAKGDSLVIEHMKVH